MTILLLLLCSQPTLYDELYAYFKDAQPTSLSDFEFKNETVVTKNVFREQPTALLEGKLSFKVQTDELLKTRSFVRMFDELCEIQKGSTCYAVYHHYGATYTIYFKKTGNRIIALCQTRQEKYEGQFVVKNVRVFHFTTGK